MVIGCGRYLEFSLILQLFEERYDRGDKGTGPRHQLFLLLNAEIPPFLGKTGYKFVPLLLHLAEIGEEEKDLKVKKVLCREPLDF